jgi:hypothetical protein
LDVNRKPKSPDSLRRFWLPSEPLAHRQNVSFGAFEPGGFRTASGSDTVLHQLDALEHIGDGNGPSVPGTAEIVMGRDAIWRVYRAYWKTHPAIMVFIAFSIRRRIGTRKQVLIRVHPDEPNPLAGATDPVI